MPVSSQFREAASKAVCRPIYIVRIYLDGEEEVEGENVFSFASAPGYSYPASVTGVTENSISYDPIERASKMSGRSVVFRAGDGVFRRISSQHTLRGRRLRLFLGFEGLAEADFAIVATLTIHEIEPGETSIEVRCEPQLSLQSDLRVQGFYINWHPYRIISQVLGLDPLIDASSWAADDLDPELDPDVGHFQMSRAPFADGTDFPPYEGFVDWVDTPYFPASYPTITETWQDIAKAVGMLVAPDETGKWRFKRYKPAAPRVAVIRRRDITSFRQLESFSFASNRFVAETHPYVGQARFATTDETENGETDRFGLFVRDNVDAQASGQPFVARQVEERSLVSAWINGTGWLDGISFKAETESAVFLHSGDTGFSGCYSPPVESGYDYDVDVPSWAKVTPDSGRKVYVMFAGNQARSVSSPTPDADASGFREIMVFNYVVPEIIPILPSPSSSVQMAADGSHFPRYFRFYLDDTAPRGGRQQFEIDPPDLVPGVIDADLWNVATVVLDVTIPVYWHLNFYQRFAHGAPTIEFTTGLDKIDIALGDFVGVEDDTFLAAGLDGSNENTIFEIVAKEIRALDDSPGIRWTGIFVRQD